MATTETTETTETLRAAIEAAMRRRDPGVRVSVTPAAGQTLASVDGPSSALVWGSSMADTADEALRRLARGFGLRDDGSDPVADVERLTRALHDVAERLGCADYDDVVAAVSDALDDAEKREREHVDEANALRMERWRLTRRYDELANGSDAFVTRVWAAATGDTQSGLASAAEIFAAVEVLRRERDRLQRACDEGLPRERIDCPACGVRHVEGPRHDDPSVDGRTRPHHTHRCYHCGHVWDAGRWIFGVAEGEETAVAPSDVARLDDAARGAFDDLARVRGELDAARAALCQYAPRCECGALATRTVGYDDCEPSTLRRVCDREACGRGLPVSGESAHAAAVRAAVLR